MKVLLITALVFLGLSVSCSYNEAGQPVTALIETAADTLHYLTSYDSIGVEVGDSTMMFGSIWGTSFTPDGRIAVLDRSIGGVRFYDDQGEYLSSFIPAGEGPGEFLDIDRIVFNEDGSFFLSSLYDRKVALFDSQQNFIREIMFDNPFRAAPTRIGSFSNAGFVGDYMVMDVENEIVFTQIGLFTDSNEPDLVFRTRTVPIAEQVNARHLTAMKFAVASNGRVYIADYVWDRYEILCYSPEGDSLFAFEMPDYQEEARPDSVIEAEYQKALEQYVNYFGSDEGFNYNPPPFYYPVISIQIDGANRIWVRGQLNTESADIFDENGTFLYTVEFEPPTWQECDSWNVRVSPNGILVDPRNPEMYPVVYMLKEEVEVTQI